jgi:DNA-binding response OmpR family regulator
VTPPIVIADDSATMLRLIRRALEEDGYEIVTAADGEEALERVREHAPRLLILDAEMPKRDGYDVARTLRDDVVRPYVLMLTAGGRESDRLQAQESGVDEFMTKPFSPSGLRARVRDVLAGS